MASHLSLFDYNPNEPNVDFRCGNSKFSDNIWDFNGIVDVSDKSKSRSVINFEQFTHKPRILKVVKLYVVDKINLNKFSTAKRNYEGLIRFIKFIDKYQSEIDSFEEINIEILKLYFEYLLSAKNEATGKPLSATGIKIAAFSIKEILVKGSVKGWDVPKNTLYVQRMYDEMIIHNKRFKRERETKDNKIKNKVADKNVVDLIIRTAIKDLEKDENVLMAGSILISSQIGLRINEVLEIPAECLVKINGEMMLKTITKKLTAEPIEVLKPANDLVVFAINKIKNHTASLREETNLTNLFINRTRNQQGYPVGRVSHSNWNKNYVRPWIKMHNITYNNGELVDFTSHTFRHVFATYALKAGASISVISELMNHKSIRGTKHYTHLLMEDIRKNFAEIFSPEAVLAGKKAPQIKKRLQELQPFKGETRESIDQIRKEMKVQILSHGICTHHPMRNEPCIGDGVCLGCNNFITTPQFLDVHESRLKNVRQAIEKAPSEGIFKKKLENMEKNLLELINDLKNQQEYKGNNNNAKYEV